MDQNTAPALSHAELDRLWVASARYFMGRATADTHAFCDSLVAHWKHLSESTQSIIRRDLKEAIERDDRDRASDREHCALGHRMDSQKWRVVWETVCL